MNTRSKMIGSAVLFSTVTSLTSLVSCTNHFSESYVDRSVGFNGSFEHVKKGLPVNWMLYTQETAQEGEFDIEIDSSLAIEGSQSLKFTVKECSAKGGRYSPGIAQEVAVIPGEKFKVSFYLRNENCEFIAKVNAVSAFGKEDGPQLHSSKDISDWKKHEYTYQIPDGMKRLRFELNVLSAGNLWVDDVRIEKIK